MNSGAMTEIGLISDTHLPDRCPALPAAVFTALRGVDVVLHAGDVGELRVLDELSAIAPVVAVHGNDDTAEAQHDLPYRQLVVASDLRLLLYHGHELDRERELANRRDDAWPPKLTRRATLGQQAGARVVVFGHTHIPMAWEIDGVLLVNPGAIASPNYATRQSRQTVARLTVGPDGAVSVVHRDLAAPEVPYAPAIDWAAGFKVAHDQVTASILDPTLATDWPRLVEAALALGPEVGRRIMRRAAEPCWAGRQATVGRADWLAALHVEPDLLAEARARLESLLTAR